MMDRDRAKMQAEMHGLGGDPELDDQDRWIVTLPGGARRWLRVDEWGGVVVDDLPPLAAVKAPVVVEDPGQDTADAIKARLKEKLNLSGVGVDRAAILALDKALEAEQGGSEG